jgi:hypothetical protein
MKSLKVLTDKHSKALNDKYLKVTLTSFKASLTNTQQPH